MRICLFIFFMTGVSLCFAGEDSLPEIKALQAGMPQDVSLFITRVTDCNHWSGEEPYDKERAAFISKAVEKLRCGELEADEKHIRSKYRNSPKILESIKKSKDIYW